MAAELWQNAASIVALAVILTSLVGDAQALTVRARTTVAASSTVVSSSTTPTTSATMPPDPTNILYIAVPVGILLGVPLLIAVVLCAFGLSAAMSKASHKAQNNRVTPIQDPDYNDITTPVERVSIPADDPFAYGYGDAPLQDGQASELERQPRYAQDWNY